MKYLLLVFCQLSFAGLISDIDNFAQSIRYHSSDMRDNYVLRIYKKSAIDIEEKTLGSHTIVIGLPSKRPRLGYKNPIIIATGLTSVEHVYSDLAASAKELGHPVIIISPPGHGAHETYNVTPLYKGDHHFSESFGPKIARTMDYLDVAFKDMKFQKAMNQYLIFGHSLGGLQGVFGLMYGMRIDEKTNQIVQDASEAIKSWKRIKGVHYLMSPLLLGLKDQDPSDLEQTKKILSPLMKKSSKTSLSFYNLIRPFYEAPHLGFAARLPLSVKTEVFIRSTFSLKSLNNESTIGMMNPNKIPAGEIARLMHMPSVTENLPEGVKFGILISGIFQKWVNSFDVYQRLLKRGLIDSSEIHLKRLNDFLYGLLTHPRKDKLKLGGLRAMIDHEVAFFEIQRAVERTSDLEEIFQNPTSLFFEEALNNKPTETASVAIHDPLGNWEKMLEGFSNPELRRFTYLSDVGHLGPLFYSFSKIQFPFLIEDFNNRILQKKTDSLGVFDTRDVFSSNENIVQRLKNFKTRCIRTLLHVVGFH